MMRGGTGLLCSTLICRIPFVSVGSSRRMETPTKESQEIKDSTALPSGSHAQRTSCTGPFSAVNVVWNDERCGEEEKMLALIKEQEERRIARREAFLKWQAGQREKGAAHRLVRQAKTQEKFKRHHYHAQSGRLISIALSHVENTSHNSSDGGMDFVSSSSFRHEGERGRATNFLFCCGTRTERRTPHG
ncbi:hypothetical protein C3747_287g14 [Trypanosoma cruzi]|uniref:Excreted/secreted protein 23 n=2 Tax=Trypanosoma cruzi TaxID=5693 RepID=Q4CX89_TRYCC|nr:hypothetical protein, conserved [Trypanosoma cruzi]EAN84891.1 hypothetical protein, conserved [Trypanosoma cruzi]PWU93883.1 hypothetical protein C3747_287g14 [Trypanosoma cruzi]|eukprot:XP_806742.1 hypothetical protein [Trypanosoma cruzi strain CL Brener]